MNLQKACLIAGALFGVTGVSLGAWGAHGLAAYLGTADTGGWDTAVLYQLVHALGLLAIGALLQGPHRSRLLDWSGMLMILGILLFSGSIYALVLGAPRWLGPVTPLGGVSFIWAWLLLLIAAVRWPQS